jgi:hypothetical protein
MNIVWLAFPFPRAPKLLSGLRAPEALRDQGVRRAKNGLFGAHSAFKFGLSMMLCTRCSIILKYPGRTGFVGQAKRALSKNLQ